MQNRQLLRALRSARPLARSLLQKCPLGRSLCLRPRSIGAPPSQRPRPLSLQLSQPRLQSLRPSKSQRFKRQRFDKRRKPRRRKPRMSSRWERPHLQSRRLERSHARYLFPPRFRAPILLLLLLLLLLPQPHLLRAPWSMWVQTIRWSSSRQRPKGFSNQSCRLRRPPMKRLRLRLSRPSLRPRNHPLRRQLLPRRGRLPLLPRPVRP